MRFLTALIILLTPIAAYAQFTTTPTAPTYIGTPTFTDTGIAIQSTGNINAYYQMILQNTNSGSSSSADFIVNNNLGTANTYYGDFGINSSTFSGTGSLNLPNATYLYAQNGDLALGTETSNAIHFVINQSGTDAVNISTSGLMTVGNGIVSGGSTFTITSGCGSPTQLTGGATTGSFKSGQIACAPVISLPTAPNGWWCQGWDITTNTDTVKMTGSTVSSCTLSGTTVSGDVIVFHAEGY